RGLGRDVVGRQPGPSGGQDDRRSVLRRTVTPQRLLDRGAVVRDNLLRHHLRSGRLRTFRQGAAGEVFAAPRRDRSRDGDDRGFQVVLLVSTATEDNATWSSARRRARAAPVVGRRAVP